MKKRIYIAGKVTGLGETEVVLNFRKADFMLRCYDFLPINPLEVVNDPKCLWQEAMRLTIGAMMQADAVYLLDNWKKSKGAIIEKELAEKIGKPVFENYEALSAHFGQLPVHLCEHPEDKRSLTVIGGHANCEITVITCGQCGKHLTEPETDC